MPNGQVKSRGASRSESPPARLSSYFAARFLSNGGAILPGAKRKTQGRTLI
ncbi:MAG TPA: hypothetical protein VF723_17395 [Pyrinomonadaceae bacterium]|jgi:hypothetical protein